jgi:hypothetical protein
LGVKDTAEWLRRLPFLVRIKDVSDIQIACADQVSDVPVVRQKIFVESEDAVFVTKGCIRFIQSGIQLVDLGLKGRRACGLLVCVFLDGCDLVTERLSVSLRSGELLTEGISLGRELLLAYVVGLKLMLKSRVSGL